jgi:hypothetical protein
LAEALLTLKSVTILGVSENEIDNSGEEGALFCNTAEGKLYQLDKD